ncbi:MAG: glucose-1-phosphate thymidylyltransferase RfbA [Polyangiaceae bacterium]
MTGDLSPTRKGIVLAGGRGTRLYPLTRVVNKHLLPVHDKPMIYYPLSTLMLGGLRDILIISGPEHIPSFEQLLGDGSHLGVRFSYAAQANPTGIAEAFLIAEEFLAGEGCALILGDSLFWGYLDFLRDALRAGPGATIYAYPVKDPAPYGIVELDARGLPLSIEEKPLNPRSKLAIPGLYVVDGSAVEIAKTMKPSPRGELEITDVLQAYLARGKLRVKALGRGMAWLDVGTSERLLSASDLVAGIETRQGLRIGCLEEIALRMKYRTRAELGETIRTYPESPYRSYVESLLAEPAP